MEGKALVRDALNEAAKVLLKVADIVDAGTVYNEILDVTKPEGRDNMLKLGFAASGKYNGLGTVFIPPGETVRLTDTMNRNAWARRLHLTADTRSTDQRLGTATSTEVPKDQVVVQWITRAGLPHNIGNQDAPLSQFADFDLESESSETCFLWTGQQITVGLKNNGTEPVFVTGGIDCDEMTYEGMGALHEAYLRMTKLLHRPLDLLAEETQDRPSIDDWIRDPKNYGVDSETREVYINEHPSLIEFKDRAMAFVASLKGVDNLNFMQQVPGYHEVMAQPDPIPKREGEDFREMAVRLGMVDVDRRIGMGPITVRSGLNRFTLPAALLNLWPSAVFFSPREPGQGPYPRIHQLSVAGLPMHNAWGAPLDTYPIDKTEEVSKAFRVDFPSRGILLMGQTIEVLMAWDGPDTTLDVTLLADALRPEAQRKWMEETLVASALRGPMGLGAAESTPGRREQVTGEHETGEE